MINRIKAALSAASSYVKPAFNYVVETTRNHPKTVLAIVTVLIVLVIIL